MGEVREHFRPEFINRIDEVVVFNTLTKEAINQILDKIIKEIEVRLKDLHLTIELTKSARDAFIERGYDVNYGARPLKRLVGRTLEVDLSKMIIEGIIKEKDRIIIDYKDDSFKISKK